MLLTQLGDKSEPELRSLFINSTYPARRDWNFALYSLFEPSDDPNRLSTPDPRHPDGERQPRVAPHRREHPGAGAQALHPGQAPALPQAAHRQTSRGMRPAPSAAQPAGKQVRLDSFSLIFSLFRFSTRSEIQLTINWIRSHYEEDPQVRDWQCINPPSTIYSFSRFLCQNMRCTMTILLIAPSTLSSLCPPPTSGR